MGLAGNYTKEKIGLDPRNTQWANDTGRFGHKHLCKLGWKPGSGLGSSMTGAAKHIQVKVKSDAKGLGKPNKEDLPTGLDVFQRILGKLNGNEEQVSRQMAEKKRQSGMYLNFVFAGVLEGTIEATPEDEDDETTRVSADDIPLTSKKAISKERSAKSKERRDKKSSKKDKEKKSKKERKDKKERKAEKESKKHKEKTKQAALAALEPTPSRESTPETAASGIRAMRSRYIAMKRKATADAQSLKEIFMQT